MKEKIKKIKISPLEIESEILEKIHEKVKGKNISSAKIGEMILEEVKNRKYLFEDWQELNARDDIKERLGKILLTEELTNSKIDKILDSKWFGAVTFIGMIFFVFIGGVSLYLDFTNKIHLSPILKGAFLLGLFAIIMYPLKRFYKWLTE